MQRTFKFLGELTEDGFISHDRDEVRQTLLDLEGAVYQLGGIVQMSAVRDQISEDTYITTGVVVAYDSFAPVREREPEPEEAETP
jgi:hypothetical protein